MDAETGLYNYDARLYDPVIGRFITADSMVPEPFNPQSLNRFSYCLNNPLIYTDPNGHEPADPFDIDYGGPGAWGTPPAPYNPNHRVISKKTMTGIGVATGLMVGGSLAAGTTAATAAWNGAVAFAAASFKAFCEFVGVSIINNSNPGDVSSNLDINPSENPGYDYTNNSPEDIDYGGYPDVSQSENSNYDYSGNSPEDLDYGDGSDSSSSEDPGYDYGGNSPEDIDW